jgi:hypothetical protein
VRFVEQATKADITTFLQTYKASLIEGSGAGAIYRLGFSEASLSQEELAQLTSRMAREQIVAFIAVQR